MSEKVIVSTLPKCDFCDERARYDARIPSYTSWGYVCETHFQQFGCTLGTGRGQKLILKEVKSNDDKSM
jgi:hypothetical protein